MYKVASELIYNINKVTRGNNFRLRKNRSNYDLKKFSFINRIVSICSSLLTAVVDVHSVDLFKSGLDNFGCPKMLNMIRPTLSTLPVPEIDQSMTLKVFEKL